VTEAALLVHSHETVLVDVPDPGAHMRTLRTRTAFHKAVIVEFVVVHMLPKEKQSVSGETLHTLRVEVA
jgi:hypothetical protein